MPKARSVETCSSPAIADQIEANTSSIYETHDLASTTIHLSPDKIFIATTGEQHAVIHI